MRRWIVTACLLGSPTLASAGDYNFDWSGAAQLHISDLASDVETKRVAAIRLLAQMDLSLIESPLLHLLNDQSLVIRREAALALGARQSRRAIPVLLTWLTSAETALRATAAEALGGIGGSQAKEALIRTLTDTEGSVRQKAVQAIGKLGVREEAEVGSALIPLLEDEKSEVRREVIEQIVALRERRAVIPLASRLGDSSVDMRKAACRALGLLGDPTAAPALLRLFETDPSEDVRLAAVEAIGGLGFEPALAPLAERIGSGITGAMQRRILAALGKIAATAVKERARSEALTLLVNHLELAPSEASDAIIQIGPPAVAALLAQLDSKPPSLQRRMLALLAKTADAKSAPALLAEAEQSRIPPAALLPALGRTKSSLALPYVLSKTNDSDPAVRLAALTALAPLLKGDARALDALIARLTDTEPAIAALAATLLGEIAKPTAAPALIEATKQSGNRELRLAALAALGRIDGAPGSDALLAALGSNEREVAHAASRALAGKTDPSLLTQLQKLMVAVKPAARERYIIASLAAARSPKADPNALLAAAHVDRLDGLGQTAWFMVASTVYPRLNAKLRSEFHRIASGALAGARSYVTRSVALDTNAEQGSVATQIRGALSSPIDAVANSAALTLAAQPPHEASVAALALRLATDSWATNVTASAALARQIRALPQLAKSPALSERIRFLASHQNVLVRHNVVQFVTMLPPSNERDRAIVRLLRHDQSEQIRRQMRLALSSSKQTWSADIATALARRDIADDNAALLTRATEVNSDKTWRLFDIIDKQTGRPAKQRGYFMLASDGLIYASISDDNGLISLEGFPTGTLRVGAKGTEAQLYAAAKPQS